MNLSIAESYSSVGSEGQFLKTDCPYRPIFGRFVLINKRPSEPTYLDEDGQNNELD